MRKFYITRETYTTDYFLGVYDPKDHIFIPRYLCFLSPRIFKLPKLKPNNTVQIKELLLKKRTILTRPYGAYHIVTRGYISSHCSRLFKKYTHKRFHMSIGNTFKPVTSIKLKLS